MNANVRSYTQGLIAGDYLSILPKARLSGKMPTAYHRCVT